MAKKIRIVLTLQLPAGKATPAPPVGPGDLLIVSAGPGAPNELYNEDQQLAFVVFQGADSVPIIRSF